MACKQWWLPDLTGQELNLGMCPLFRRNSLTHPGGHNARKRPPCPPGTTTYKWTSRPLCLLPSFGHPFMSILTAALAYIRAVNGVGGEVIAYIWLSVEQSLLGVRLWTLPPGKVRAFEYHLLRPPYPKTFK